MNPLNPVARPCEKRASAPQGKENSPRGRDVCQESARSDRRCVFVVGGFAGGSACAEDWRRGEFEYMREPYHFGPLCEYGIRARGSAPVALFGGAREVRKAEARSIDWEFEASRVFGPTLRKLGPGHGQRAAVRRQRPEIRVCRKRSSLPAAVM
jgi:hypothetical protein